MKRKRVQPKRSGSTQKRRIKKKPVKPPVSFSEMVLNWVIGILAVVILVFLASLAYRFFTGKKSNTSDELTLANQAQVLRQIPRIEVLNGCGVGGIAAKFTDYLRDQGFDVVNTDNYLNFNVDSSFVIDRRSMQNAYGEKLAVALGIPVTRVRPILSDEMTLEATLVLGKDYRSLNGYAEIRQN